MVSRTVYVGNIDVEDGYQLGAPDLDALDPEVPVTVTTNGLIVTTDPATETVAIEVYLSDESAAVGSPEPTAAPAWRWEGDVDVQEPWGLWSWDLEPPTPMAPSIVGPGQWHLSYAASPAGPRDVDGSDLAEVVVENHFLVLSPRDELARSWPVETNPEATLDQSRDNISEVQFLRSGIGAWTLSWGESLGAPSPTEQGVGERVEQLDSTALLRFDRTSQITVMLTGRSFHQGRVEPLLGERWVAHLDVAIPDGREMRLFNPKRVPARGLPEVIATGPARLIIALRDPQSYDFVQVDPCGKSIKVYDRDTRAAQDMSIHVLLE